MGVCGNDVGVCGNDVVVCGNDVDGAGMTVVGCVRSAAAWGQPVPGEGKWNAVASRACARGRARVFAAFRRILSHSAEGEFGIGSWGAR